MPSTTTKVVDQFKCDKNQVPGTLYRVRYSGNQSLKARSKPAFKDASDFTTAVELHLTWCSCKPTPFVSLFADGGHAVKWGQQLLEHGYHDVVLVEIDSSQLGPLFRVRDLVGEQQVHTALPERIYEDEFLVLRKIPRRSVVNKIVVERGNTAEEDDESRSSGEEESDNSVAI